MAAPFQLYNWYLFYAELFECWRWPYVPLVFWWILWVCNHTRPPDLGVSSMHFSILQPDTEVLFNIYVARNFFSCGELASLPSNTFLSFIWRLNFQSAPLWHIFSLIYNHNLSFLSGTFLLSYLNGNLWQSAFGFSFNLHNFHFLSHAA